MSDVGTSGSTIALADCRIARACEGRVELVRASRRDRSFPTRVSESLGFCLKFGVAHEVQAGGRTLVYPRDALCVRTPGCVWSTKSTGPVGFVSLDLERELVPEDLATPLMCFAPGEQLREFALAVAALSGTPSRASSETALATLVERAQALGLLEAPSITRTVSERRLARARECIEESSSGAPSLAELSALVGLNRFALVRQFRARYGATPHALSVLLRVERSKRLLTRGARSSEVARALGFADQAHFGRAFKRVVGLSPVAYSRAARTHTGGSTADQFRSRPQRGGAAGKGDGEDVLL